MSTAQGQNDQDFMTVMMMMLGVLVLVAVIIFFAAQLIASLGAGDARRSEINSARQAVVESNIAPIGRVVTSRTAEQEIAAAEDGEPAETDQADDGDGETVAAAASERSASSIANGVCAACHNSGALGAPVVGDTSAWRTRYDARGLDTLVSHAINGYNQMPARGGDSSLSDAEVRKATVYMLEESDISVAGADGEQGQRQADAGDGSAGSEAQVAMAATTPADADRSAGGVADEAAKAEMEAKGDQAADTDQGEQAPAADTAALAVAEAAALYELVDAKGFAWRDTAELLERARGALTAGNRERAELLAKTIAGQARNGLEQAVIAGVLSERERSSAIEEALASAKSRVGDDAVGGAEASEERASEPAQDPAQQAIAEAEALYNLVDRHGYAWRDTRDLLSQARTAQGDGDSAQARDLAQRVAEQARLGLEQAVRAGSLSQSEKTKAVETALAKARETITEQAAEDGGGQPQAAVDHAGSARAVASDESQARVALESARAAFNVVSRLGYAWRDTAEDLDAAARAFDNGQFESAATLATRVEQHARRGLEQAVRAGQIDAARVDKAIQAEFEA